MTSVGERTVEMVAVGGIELEVERRGKGRQMLVLHGEEGLELHAPALDELTRDFALTIPSPPGFGHSPRPDWVSSPDDISYMYLDLVDKFGLSDAVVVGFGLGGWIAAEMLTKSSGFASKLVLVDALGVKIGGPLDRDIQDIWMLNQATVAQLLWFDPEAHKRDFTAMSDDALTVVARNRESFARFCWDPYMHNPKLTKRLHRITLPTLVVWGENDGFVTPSYGQAYAGLIPGAEFATIAQAGHYPHIEQPKIFVDTLRSFVG